MKHPFETSVTCRRSMKLLGDYWTLRIIEVLANGETRFCELQRALDNLNPVTLTSRLRKLEAERLVTRTEETKTKSSVSYQLTELGNEALPVIAALDKFSKKKQAV